MASVETVLIAALKANATIAAMTAGRISVWGGLQDPAYPYVTIQRISTPTAEHLNGPATLQWPRIQFDIWATKATEAMDVAEAIRTAIDNVAVAGNPGFTATFQDQRGPAPDSETRSFGVSQDYFLYHER